MCFTASRLFIFLFLLNNLSACTQTNKSLLVKGLHQPVEIVRDRWGIAHIYAKNEHDLFFAQGYSAASERLFQLEVWRRQATGTVAAWLGPQELNRDIGTRLFRFRGNLEQELKHYHPHGPQIIQAFVDGINAYIREIRQNPDKLPFEFRQLGTLPEYWTPEIVISRHQGLLSNVHDELNNGRLVHLLGADQLRQVQWFHPARTPNEPDLSLHSRGEELFQPILHLYEAFKLPIQYPLRGEKIGKVWSRAEVDTWFETEKRYVGSNNWVVSGKRSASGFPMLANDPHRSQQVPSLRYWVHLNAPGWNVVGAGEPVLPGVSIGHNEFGAWGLTIFETDNEDLYVYETNPENRNQYRYAGRWESVTTQTETIPVKGQPLVAVTLKYTRHGPVVFEDAKNGKIYAVRAGWREVGCAPYLASLRMNQAQNWDTFRQACVYSRIPGENMIWAGRNGEIGWQAVGISPIRRNWTGLVPVPGDGRFEWDGYLPILEMPHKLNPPDGYVVTANNNQTPTNFPHRNAIGWVWANPVRSDRIKELITGKPKQTLSDFKAIQADYLSISARTLVPLLKPLKAGGEPAEWARQQLLNWDFQLAPNSIPASVYVLWEGYLRGVLYQLTVPENARPYLKNIPAKRMVDWLTRPETLPLSPGEPRMTAADRDTLVLTCLGYAMQDLTERLGSDRSRWQYGQPANKHIFLEHPLAGWLSSDEQARVNIGPAPRGGYSETVNNTGSKLNQEHGASFRILVDTQDWDKTLGINNPGQSGDPASPHYRDLFPIWARNDYFPVYFSKEKIKTVMDKRLVLYPGIY